MAVSPADFELYSRATGAPIPRDPQERMRMAPEVYNFSRNFAREPSGFRKAANTAVKAAKLGSLLAGAYGVSQAFGPEVGAVASAVVDEVTKGNEKPVVEEKPRHQRTSTAVGGLGTKSMQIDRLKEGIKQDEEKIAALKGNETKNIRHPTPFREKMSDISNIGGIYDAVRTDSLRNELNDEFEEPYVRIPTKREPKRDLSAEADAKAAEILGGQLELFDEGNTRRYDRFEGAGLTTKGRTDTRGPLRRTAEDASLNRPIEKDILEGGVTATGAAVVKNAVDAANIVAGGEPMGNAVTNTVTQALGGVKEAALQKIAPYHALTESIQGGVETAQNVYEGIRGLGFGPGATVGQVLDFGAQQASRLPGVQPIAEIGGNVLEAMGQVATNMPIEVFFGLTGAVGGAAAMGVARGLNKTSKVGNTLIDQAGQVINKAQKVINSVKTDHAQIDSPGQDQKRIAPNKTIHTGGSIQGSEPGLGAQVDSGSPQTNRRREELRETFRKSLGTVPPEKREALIDQQLEKESNSKGLSQLKNFVSKVMSSEPKKEDGAVLISEPQEEDVPDWDPSVKYVRSDEGQQGPATHLIRRTAEQEANPRNRYKGAIGVSTDLENEPYRTDVYFRASPQATGGSGVQMRSYYSDDPAVGRQLEHDALDTTQRHRNPATGEDMYMMSDAQLKARSFMKSFNKRKAKGGLRIAVDDEGNPMRADDPWWGKEEQQQGSTEWVRSPDGKLRKKV